MGRKAAMTGRVVALSECLQRVFSVDFVKLINRVVDGNVDDNGDDKDDVDYLKRGLLVSLLNPRHCVHRHMPRIAHSSTCLVWMFVLFVILKKAKCLLDIFYCLPCHHDHFFSFNCVIL